MLELFEFRFHIHGGLCALVELLVVCEVFLRKNWLFELPLADTFWVNMVRNPSWMKW